MGKRVSERLVEFGETVSALCSEEAPTQARHAMGHWDLLGYHHVLE